MPLMNSKLAACADSALVAVSVKPARPALVIAPVAEGKKFLATTPFSATMKNVNTGAAPAAQADRSGKLSKNGSAMAIEPAPFKKLRLFTLGRPIPASALDLTVHLQTGF